MTTRIKLRRDTKANWADVNPILAAGEMGLESDTRRTKIGDGLTPWSGLQYTFGDLSVTDKTINSEMGVSIASQDPETWISTVKSRGNWAGTTGVAYDSMGNLYLAGWEEAGFLLPGDGEQSAFLIKYDSQGSVLWKRYTQLQAYTEGDGVVVDSNDDVIVSSVDWDNGFFAITKYTSEGVLVWQKTYQDDNIEAKGTALAIDSNDDIVVVGQRPDPDNNNNTGIFVMKLVGTTGAVSWTKTMSYNYTNMWQARVAVDGSDNIIIAGMDNASSSGQANITKLTSSGSLVWSKTLRNQEDEWSGYELDLGNIDADADDNIYFVGAYKVPNFVVDIQGVTADGRAGLILMMNSSGVIQWSKIVGPGDCNDLGAQLVYKAGKLYAAIQTERRYYKNDFNNSGNYTTQEILVACLDAATGKTEWANNFGPEILWGTVSPTSNSYTGQDNNTDASRLIAVHGDYVAIAGQASEYSRAEDELTRSYGFLAQLPASGEEMDLSGWKYKATKSRAQYAQIQIRDYADFTVNSTTDLFVSGTDEYLPTNTATNVVVELLASGANQWDFKPNGDLALPVGGNIEITRPKQGSINVVGYFDSNNTNGVGNVFSSVTTDADGNQYYVGIWNWHDNSTPNGNSLMPMVVKVNAQGEVEWKVRLSNNQLNTTDAVYGGAHTVAYDPASGNIVVVCTDSSEGQAEQMLIVDLDPTNGKVVEQHRYAQPSNSPISVYNMAINTLGERFITGSLQGDNNVLFTVTNAMVESPGTANVLLVPRTAFEGHTAPTWLNGTVGWSVNTIGDVTSIDNYPGTTGTVRQGSGATFNISIDGSGAITGAVVGAGGVNYRTGHKILVDHTAVDGSDNNSDIILTVTSATNGVIETVAAGYYGSGGGAPGTWGGTTGTNYQVASGFAIDVQVNGQVATDNLIVSLNTGGNRYVVGDVITFPGTSFGGTSPATDVVITVLQAGEFAGDVQPSEGNGFEVTTRGVSPLTYIRLAIDNNPDFTTGGPWDLKNYTDANTFLAKFVSTATTSTNLVWAKHIEKASQDQGIAVDYDSHGNLYWASRIYDESEPGEGNRYYRPVITKLSSTGTTLWSTSYSLDTNNNSTPTGLQVDSEDQVVLSYVKWNNLTQMWNPVVKRISSSGDSLWTKKFLMDGNEGGVALDNDDNIYVNSACYDGQNDVSWTAKLDIQDGNTVWQEQTSNQGKDMLEGFTSFANSIAVDSDKYYVAKWTFGLDGGEGNAVAIALPTDGSAADTQHGPFAVTAVSYNTEGGYGDGNFNASVNRTYTVTDASPHFDLITNRYDIQSWLVPDPISSYPVYTKSDAGIVFGDGTVQTTSGQGLPQVRMNRYNKYSKLKLSDSGKHLYTTNQNQIIEVPTYSEVQFPVGTMITIVNISGGSVYIAAPRDNWRTTLYCPPLDGNEGGQNDINGFRFYDNGGGNFITLLKVEEGHSNGSRWIVTGNNANQFGNIDPLNP